MGEYKKYWIAVVAVLIIGFSILGYLGTDVYHHCLLYTSQVLNCLVKEQVFCIIQRI